MNNKFFDVHEIRNSIKLLIAEGHNPKVAESIVRFNMRIQMDNIFEKLSSENNKTK